VEKLEHLDRAPPRQLLRVVDLTQVQHVPLHHAPPGGPRVLDNALVAMLLAIFRRTLQRRNMMAADYRHIGGVENRLGRHYSRFSPFSPTPALADQSLARRKLWNAGSNRRSRAKVASAWAACRNASRFRRSCSSRPRGISRQRLFHPTNEVKGSSLFDQVYVLSILLVPVLTMRAFVEERRTDTLELLTVPRREIWTVTSR